MNKPINISNKIENGINQTKNIVSYNSFNLPATNEDGEGRKSFIQYDYLGRPTRIRYVNNIDAVFTTIEYGIVDNSESDLNGTYHNYLKETDEIGNIFKKYFDVAGNLVYEIKYDGTDRYLTKYEYDEINRLTKVTPPSGNTEKTITYTYDELNYLREKTTPDEGKYQYQYDKWGNLRFKFHYNTTPYELVFTRYDALNRPIIIGKFPTNQKVIDNEDYDPDVTYDSGPNSFENIYTDTAKFMVVNMYNKYERTGVFSSLPNYSSNDIKNMNLKGRLVSTAFRDKPGDTWNYKIYHYDYLGRIKRFQVKYGNNDWKDIFSEYDHQGNLTKQNINGEHYIWNEYDLQSRLTKVKSHPSDVPSSAKTEALYKYNAADQITKLGGNNYSDLDIGKVDYTYDNRGRLKSIANYYEYTP